MAPRVSSDLLLAGSLPATPTEEAFRASAELFGHLVFALPDGETGPRAGWVGDERERLLRPNPGIATVQETLSATGVPRHAYETPVFQIRPGFTSCTGTSGPIADCAFEDVVANSTGSPQRSRPPSSRSSGMSATRFSISRGWLPGPRQVPGNASQERLTG